MRDGSRRRPERRVDRPTEQKAEPAWQTDHVASVRHAVGVAIERILTGVDRAIPITIAFAGIGHGIPVAVQARVGSDLIRVIHPVVVTVCGEERSSGPQRCDGQKSE